MRIDSVSDLYLITPEWHGETNDGNAANGAAGVAGRADFAPFLERLERALCTGIDLVQLRAKSLSPGRYHALAAAAREVCHGRGAMLILNGPTACATGEADRDRHADGIHAADGGSASALDHARADGIHLSSARLMACERRPVAASCVVSAACHTLAELRQAARIGVDFITLSPVLRTRTHPDAAPLGWVRFAELVAASPVPVYALGGMTRAHLATAQSCGARGIAAISGLW
ncbi:thiamine phosphate synthase [Robbsia sp. Bb-Pol-6]|uniref:Thiamine phosphate synthase n=1 Tax=Robbsia betulipollinis TaxID=2981849 RepID=A0ABT3ZTE9_9BURK|nr:thiamine phosphate synthase [Robbsia betulipollinis]MCY0389722.1 thiamine phosphate synthase [Robbsia betulipollinis]